MRPVRIAAGFACLALACAAAPAPTPAPPALVALEVLRGFAAPPASGAAPRVVAIVDATEAMSWRDAEGSVLLDAARAGAGRFLHELPPATPVSRRVLGGTRSAACGSGARELEAPAEAGEAAWVDAFGGLAPAGQGSLAEALSELARSEAAPRPTPLRVVAWSALRDRCDASLCDAAAALARAGARLDLVVLGNAPAPACLAGVEQGPGTFTPPGRQGRVGVRVERLTPEPVVIGCSESGGPPIAVPRGPTRVVVGLDPPLVLERSFPADTRWVLEVVDFPTLGSGERLWRWRPMVRAGRFGARP